MVLYWAAILAISTLLYVLLDGFDLGVGILSIGARSDEQRDAMMSAIAPIWDGNETWLVVTGVVLWSAFPIVYATLLSAFYLPLILMLAGRSCAGSPSNSDIGPSAGAGCGARASPGGRSSPPSCKA